MSNIINLHPSSDDLYLQKELDLTLKARPIVKNTLNELLTITMRVLQQNNLGECCIHDLIYSCCIHLATVFTHVPDHPNHYKMIEQICEPLVATAKECFGMQDEWLQEIYEPVLSIGCNERMLSEINKRFIEVSAFLEDEAWLHKACHCNQSKDRQTNKFNTIEFILRNEFKIYIKKQLAELDLIFTRDSILFLLLDNTTRIGVLASLGAKHTDTNLDEFMQPALDKLTKIAKNASDF